jgi:hypothetical protein
MGMSTAKQRKFPRRQFEQKIGVLKSGKYFLIESRQLGEGGLSLTSSEDFSKEETVILNFKIPKGNYVSVKADVKNLFDTDTNLSSGSMKVVGFFFKDLDLNSRRQIRLFVAQRNQ